MADELRSLSAGDMLRCEKCGLELHVTRACACEAGCARVECCDETIKKVTEPSVPSS